MSEKRKILHFRIPVNKNGDIALKLDLIDIFAGLLEDHLGDKYDIIFTPFEFNYVDDDGNAMSVKLSEKSLTKFLKEMENNK